MTINLKDASDFSATNVSQNLYNIVVNMDKYAGANDFNISNHANAFNRKATGTEVWYYAGDTKAKPIAEKMSKAIADALGIVNRGAKATTSLYVISQSKGHTLLPEWFFIDNAEDVVKWQANKNKAIAAAIKILESYPNYIFRTTHGGHYGKNMMDPGAVGNGLKEAVVMQEVNKALLNYKAGGTAAPSTPSKPSTSNNTSKTHKVVKGDTLYGIAKRYGVTVANIKSWNDLKSDLIKVGQTLKVSNQSATTGKQVKVGSTVKFHGHATHYQTGQKIPDWVKKQSYKVLEIQKLPKKQSRSNYRYLLGGINSWVLGQDIFGV